MKLSIIVPVYNEVFTISKVITRLKEFVVTHPSEIIIVDDGSDDGTRQYLGEYVFDSVFKIILLDKNHGKGYAVREGVKNATGEFILIQDADMEYRMGDIPSLIEQTKIANVVFGNRFHPKVKHRKSMYYFGNRGLTFLTNVLFGSNIHDMEVGYKLVNKNIFNRLNLKENRFGVEPEIVAKLLKKGYYIAQVPITYNPRDREHGKKIKAKDGFIAAWVLIRERFFSTDKQ